MTPGCLLPGGSNPLWGKCCHLGGWRLVLDDGDTRFPLICFLSEINDKPHFSSKDYATLYFYAASTKSCCSPSLPHTLTYDQTAIGGIWTQCWQTVPLNVHVPEHVTDTSTDKSSSQVLELLIRKIIGCRISEAEANAEITAVTVSWCIESGWLIK